MRERIIQIILTVLADINNGQATENQIEVSADTYLFGKHSGLDSMDLVNILLDMEERVSQEFGVPITLMDERAMSQERSPFRSVSTLADYIVKLLDDKYG